MLTLGALALAPLLLAACGGSPPGTAHPTPPSLLPALNRAVHEQVEGQYAKAVAGFLAVVKQDPTTRIAWYDLGFIAHLNGQDTLARKDYRAAIGADPTYVPALYNLGILEAPHHPTVAVQLYDKVVRLRPGDAFAHLNLGFSLLDLGKTKEGKAQLAEAIKLKPSLASRVPVADGGTAS